jgi:hypothetical protein
MNSDLQLDAFTLTLGERVLLFAWAAIGAVWFLSTTNSLWPACVCNGFLYSVTSIAAAIALTIDVWRREKRKFIVTLVLLSGVMNGTGCLQRSFGLPRELPYAVAFAVVSWLIATVWPFRSRNSNRNTYLKVAACIALAYGLAIIVTRYFAGEAFAQ